MSRIYIFLVTWAFTFLAFGENEKGTSHFSTAARSPAPLRMMEMLPPLDRARAVVALLPPDQKKQFEPYLIGAQVARKPEVALVLPLSSTNNANDLTATENTKWIYLALVQNHIPVDFVTQEQVAKANLEAYKSIYAPCPNLRRDAGSKIKEWVSKGGSLWTDAFGLSRDEKNQPAPEMNEMLGLTNRQWQGWATSETNRVATLQAFRQTNAIPKGAAKIVMEFTEFEIALGRELWGTNSGKVPGRFADHQTAMIQKKFGKGKVTIFSFRAGLSFSDKLRRTTYNMRDDPDPVLRSVIGKAALEENILQCVRPLESLAEAVFFVKDRKRYVALMNWNYVKSAKEQPERLQPLEELSIDLPRVGTLTSVHSLLHGKLNVDNTDHRQTVVLPKMDAFDLLILE